MYKFKFSLVIIAILIFSNSNMAQDISSDQILDDYTVDNITVSRFSDSEDNQINTHSSFDYSQVDPNWVYPTDGPDVMLYDNGPAFNVLGGGTGGADLSLLESTTLGMNTLGAGHQFTLGYRMADDFVVPAGETWTIDSFVFYAYQTNSTTTSTITGVYFQIWDGDPSAGGTVIWGDLTTNRLSNTYWSNIYRASETTPTSTARPIMRNVAGTSGLVLTEGTYWIDWSTDGSLSSGPWAPPIAILGQSTTGNALQYTTAWAPFLDSGTSTPQGLPFEIWGIGEPEVEIVAFDIKPQTCPNPLNVKSKGVLPVVILGTNDFSVLNIDPVTLLLEGVAPLRWSVEDVSTPISGGEPCDCTTEGPDGLEDLNIKFDTQEIVAALGSVNNGEELVLTITGNQLDGTPIEGSDCVIIIGTLEKELTNNLSLIPEEYKLFDNYPNPFNPTTLIKYQVLDAGLVTLKVYDALGNEIAELVNETKEAGIYEIKFDASSLSSGVYIYQLRSNNFIDTKKMILMK